MKEGIEVWNAEFEVVRAKNREMEFDVRIVGAGDFLRLATWALLYSLRTVQLMRLS
jgi:hypothetical protein